MWFGDAPKTVKTSPGTTAEVPVVATTGAKIIAVDLDEKKRAYAESLGVIALPSDEKLVDRVIAESGGRGADVVLDYVSAQPTVDLSLKMIAQGGAFRFVGLAGGSFPYIAGSDPNIPWGVNIERPYGGNRSDLRECIALAEQGKITIDVTHRPLDEAEQAFKDLEDGKVHGRIALVP